VGAWLGAALGVLAAAAVLTVAVGGVPGYRFYAVRTASMSPTIPPRSLVVVRVGDYRLGQPVTFYRAGAVVTHRFVGRTPTGDLVTQGDANPTADASAVPPSAVVGGVVWAPRQLGYWVVYLRSPLGLASVLVSIALLWQLAALGDADAARRRLRARHRRVVAPRHSRVAHARLAD